MRKVFLTLGAIVLVAAGAAWYFITYRLDAALESRIERAASIALGSAVEVGGVNTNLSEGTLSIAEISIANPSGFENPYAVRLNAVEAAVDYGGFEIKRLVIENPEFIIEEISGETNFGRMLDALDSGAGPAAPVGDGQVDEPIIALRHFRINETRAAFESRSLDHFSEVKVEAIEMHDLRGTPSELAEQIGREVLAELSSEAATELLKAQAKKQLKEVEAAISGKLRGLLGSDAEIESEDQYEDSEATE